MLDLKMRVKAPMVVMARVRVGRASPSRLSQKKERFPDKRESKSGSPVYVCIEPGFEKQIPQLVGRTPLAGSTPAP